MALHYLFPLMVITLRVVSRIINLDIILKIQSVLLPHGAVDAGDVSLGAARVMSDDLEVLVAELRELEVEADGLGHVDGVPGVLARVVGREQRLLHLPVRALDHALGVAAVHAAEEKVDELLDGLDADARLLAQREALAEHRHHVEDEGVAEQLQLQRGLGRLVVEWDLRPPHHARRVRAQLVDGRFGPCRHEAGDAR